MPAVRFETLRRVVGEPALHFAVDRNTVVVVKRNQFAELEGAGERTRFVRDTLHQAAIAEKCVAVMVDDSVAVTVELRGENFFRQRHADGIGEALTERTGGGLDTRRVAVLGVARRARM